MTNQNYPHLFSPIKIANKELSNRVVHAAMSLRYVQNEEVNSDGQMIKSTTNYLLIVRHALLLPYFQIEFYPFSSMY